MADRSGDPEGEKALVNERIERNTIEVFMLVIISSAKRRLCVRYDGN